MFLFLDNYDSFTFNLVQIFEARSVPVGVFRNDRIALHELESLRPSALVISPGPGTPEQAGICIEAIRLLAASIPVLGVCLGHQSIAAAFGARVIRAERILHGKTSWVHHDDRTIFQGLPNPFEAARYHSLIVDESSLPDCLQVNAWTDEGEIMGLRHREFRVEGVQFHPESILTRQGEDLVHNFVRLCDDGQQAEQGMSINEDISRRDAESQREGVFNQPQTRADGRG